MFNSLRRLSLSTHLFIIGITPVLFLCYFTYLIYQEKNKTIDLVAENIEKIKESHSAQSLMENLAYERRYSFNYQRNHTELDELRNQRKKTDSSIERLEKDKNWAGQVGAKYIFLNEVDTFRKSLDQNRAMTPNSILRFYTDIIYRVNSLTTVSPPSGLFKFYVYQDFISQKILNDLITYLGIIRTQIYISLSSGENRNDFLLASSPIYRTFKGIEREFLEKASAHDVKKYRSFQNNSAFLSTIEVVDSLYNYPDFTLKQPPLLWYANAGDALLLLREQQREIWSKVNTAMNDAKKVELQKRNLSLLFLILSVSITALIILTFGINLIKILDNLADAAGKISKGYTNVSLDNFPRGSLGLLGNSILDIQENNIKLTEAANEIGKGNFNVVLTPRSDEDILGKSIKKMKKDLREYAEEKDKVQRETMELVHQRDDFFNITSHELKTPITSLKAYAQLLLLEAASHLDSPQYIMLTKMEIQVNKLIHLINNLLDTSKLQGNQLAFSMENIKLNMLVQQVIKQFHEQNKGYKIVFQKNVNGTVSGDRVRLKQVIENLLDNAIKYSPDSREAIVRLEKTVSTLRFSIKDFGVGLKPQEGSKVFGKFYRVTDEYMHTFPGVGLGLYIANEIIKKHGGKMWVESEPNKGSTFYFELPLASTFSSTSDLS